MAQKKRTADKWKKKKWFEVFAPAVLDKKKIAETMAEKPELLMGRVLNMSMRDVTGEIKKGQIYLSMKIDNVQGQKAYTVLTGHRLLPGQLNRLIRRNNSKVEVVKDMTCKDGLKSRVTALTVTARKIPRDKKTVIRKMMLEALGELAGKKNQEELVQDFVFGATATSILGSVKKVAPIKRVEIVKSRPLAK
jgi:small subunit ribosomal protein S3Ae